MVRSPDTLEAQLLRLPTPDRARLAELLLDSLDPVPGAPGAEVTPEDWETLWGAEAARRLAELRAGAAEAVPAAEVFARIAERHGR